MNQFLIDLGFLCMGATAGGFALATLADATIGVIRFKRGKRPTQGDRL